MIGAAHIAKIVTTRSIGLITVLWLLVGACTGLRPIQKGNPLYDGANLEIVGDKELINAKTVRAELESVIEPKPNQKVLGMRPALYIYNRTPKPRKDKGFNYWMKNKVGEPPVMLSEVDPGRVAEIMANRLFHFGYFRSKVMYEVVKKKKTARIRYTAHPGPQYLIDSVSFPKEGSLLAKNIGSLREGTLLQAGTPYNLDLLKSERQRIDRALKDQGYFHFGPDFLLFEVDSTVGAQRVHIRLTLKPDIPREARNIYYLRKVEVMPDYRLDDYHPDTLHLDGYRFLDNTGRFKPKPLLTHVLLDSGAVYSRSNHLGTLRQLMGMGGFQFSVVRFYEMDSLSHDLGAAVVLTPKKRYSLSYEANAIAKTNNFVGPGVKLSFKDRNIFRGVEQLSVDFNGRYEWQAGGSGSAGSSIELRLESGLRIPRIYPLPHRKNNRQYIPFTTVSMGIGIFRRDSAARTNPLYTLASFFISGRYDWRTSEQVSHSFQLVDVSYTNLIDASPFFLDYLDRNPSVKRSFEEQFVIGSNYTYTYSTLPSGLGKKGFFFSGTLGGSGNFLSLGYRLGKGKWPSAEDPVSILPEAPPFSQYLRASPEFRYYQGIGKTTLASRLLLGVAFPYGNSRAIPYIKQFYVGGANSIRAFRARSVGPGAFKSESEGNLLVDQAGDIKIEANLEYRISLFKYLQTALFIDAGNIWLFYEDNSRPLAQFDFNRFYKEIAVGTGLGLRIDLQVIVVRFDFAIPLRDPSLPEGERWRIKDIDFPNADWRKNNILLNFSIGYPF